MRLVYGVSGRAARGVAVEVTDAGGESRRLTADQSGGIRVAPAATNIVVTDPKTGIVLADRSFSADAGSQNPLEVAIATPIRVSGEVSGFGDDPARIEIDCAYGAKLTVSDYQRLVHGLSLFALPDENTIHGMALPPVARKSLRAHPDATGNFTTGWFAAVEAPELVVFQPNDGRTAVHAVPLPKDLEAGATVPAGRIAPDFGASIEIRSSIPADRLPRGLSVSVVSMDVPEADRGPVSQYLSALSRRDAALSQFLTQRRSLPVAPGGATTIAGVPPAQALKLRFSGPDPGIEYERTVQVPPHGVVRIDLGEGELLAANQPRATYSGTVRFAGGAPIAGASVIYSSYPDRYETKTGTDGRFQIAGVASGRRGLVRIEASNPGGQPPFTSFAINEEVPPLGMGAKAEPVYEVNLPAPQGQRFFAESGGGNAGETGGSRLGRQQGPPLDWQFVNCGGNYTQAELQFVSAPIITAYLYLREQNRIGPMAPIAGDGTVNAEEAIVIFQAQFRNPGYYVVFLEYTPFVYDAVYVPIPDRTTARITFRPKATMEAVQIRVRGKLGQTAPGGVQLQFPGWSDEPDSYNRETDGNGNLNLLCVSLTPPPFRDALNLDYINVFVRDPIYGYFDGFLRLPGNEGVLNLQLGEPPPAGGKQ